MMATLLAISAPVAALDPATIGNYSLTYDFLVLSEWDFKDGVGLYNPNPANACGIALLLGLRVGQPIAFYYDTLRMATNLKGPGVAVAGIDPVDLVACPVPLVPPQPTMQLWFSGINWRLGIDAMSSELNLCSQIIQSTDGGCIPDAETVVLYAADCTEANVDFTPNDNTDGKPDQGVWDVLGSTLSGSIFSDAINCGTFGHSHDYSATVTFFDVNYAAMGFDNIQNADIVHSGSGTKYAVVCWAMSYVNMDGVDLNADGAYTAGEVAPGSTATAQTHDWKLILDLGSAPTSYSGFILDHLKLTGPDFLRGLYSGVGGSGVGNGFGGCPAPTVDHDKKSDLIPLG